MMPRGMLVCLLALAIGVGPAAAQNAEAPPVIPANGPEVFCWLLKNRGISALTSVAELATVPRERTLIILFGRVSLNQWNGTKPPGAREILRLQLGDLRRYQEEGGALLFATDYAYETVPEWGLKVAQARVLQDARYAYRHVDACPLLLAVAAKAPLEFQPVAHRIATNCPSYFLIRNRRDAAGLETLADFQRDGARGTMKTDADRRAYSIYGPGDDGASQELGYVPGTTTLPFIMLAGAAKPAQGRALLIAGHGLFTNAMLLQKDNDNFLFAGDCLRWLQQGPGHKARTHALFIVDGRVIPSFDTVLKPPTPPIPAPTIQLVNQLIGGMEREGLLFRVLRELFDAPGTAGVSLVILTVLLMLYAAKKVTGQRHRAEAGALLTAGPFAAVPESAALVQQRVRSQIVQGTLGEEARALVRAWFQHTAGVAPADLDAAPVARAASVDVTGGWWQRRRLRAQVARLGQLAAQPAPSAFSWRELVCLTRQLQTLSAAVHAGQLRFPDGLPPPKS